MHLLAIYLPDFEPFGGLGGGAGFEFIGGGFAFACSRPLPLDDPGGFGLDPFLTLFVIRLPPVFAKIPPTAHQWH